jgi:hypothetical protein
MSAIRKRLGPCLVFALAAILAGCTAPVNTQRVPLTVHATSAAYPWLETAYGCTPSDAAIVLSDDPQADLRIRLGEPGQLVTPAYRIGTEEVMIVTHPQAGVGALTASQVGALFTGQARNWSEVGGSDLTVVVWAYDPSVDLQLELDRAILRGRPVSSLARLAVTAQHMSDSVGAVPGSVGLLPRRWKAGNTQEALMLATVPVLALTRTEPAGAMARLIECMQAAQ